MPIRLVARRAYPNLNAPSHFILFFFLRKDSLSQRNLLLWVRFAHPVVFLSSSFSLAYSSRFLKRFAARPVAILHLRDVSTQGVKNVRVKQHQCPLLELGGVFDGRPPINHQKVFLGDSAVVFGKGVVGPKAPIVVRNNTHCGTGLSQKCQTLLECICLTIIYGHLDGFPLIGPTCKHSRRRGH